MAARDEIREFLTSRRSRVRPESVGITTGDTRRRVAGLRREEVATIAGVSADYYVRMERGQLQGVSESVLDAVARALQMSPAEREHLFNLARLDSGAGPSRWMSPSRLVRPSVQSLLDSVASPAFVRNVRFDYLAANLLGVALHAQVFDQPTGVPNEARYVFLDPRAQDFYPVWRDVATDVVAILRAEAGRNPHDRTMRDLIRELSTASRAFRSLWTEHEVRIHGAGSVVVDHPAAGMMELSYEALTLNADLGLTLTVYSAATGSASAERLGQLGRWDVSEPSPAVPPAAGGGSLAGGQQP